MNVIIRSFLAVLSTVVIVSSFAGIPVLAKVSEQMSTESTQSDAEDSKQMSTESSQTDTSEETSDSHISLVAMVINGGAPQLGGWEEHLYEIESMDDLVEAFGVENVSVISGTEIRLQKDIIHTQDDLYCFRFIKGTYNIDFNGFKYQAKVVWDIIGGDITLMSEDSYGGLVSDPIQVTSDSAASFSALYQRGGKLTIDSGSYKAFSNVYSGEAGKLIIHGADLCAEGSYEFPSHSALYFRADLQAAINDGSFMASQYGLFCKNGSANGETGDEKLFVQLSGGTYLCDESDGELSGAIFYRGTDMNPVCDVHSLLAPGYHFNPDSIISKSYEPGDYPYSKIERVARVKFGLGVEGFVYRLYDKVLNRAPDYRGYTNWVTKLRNKDISGSDAAFGFFFSPELTKQNISNKEFITLLYNVFFDRSPDDSGMKTWLAALNTGASRKYVYAGFANSKEWKGLCESYQIEPGSYASDEPRDQNLKVTAFVQRLYTLCLDRGADVTGINNWTSALNNKSQDGAHVAYGFFFSEEFKNRNLSNDDYVEVLYEVLLGRSSDPAGKADWAKQLGSGTERMDIFRGFVHSQEFDQICASYGIVRGTI